METRFAGLRSAPGLQDDRSSAAMVAPRRPIACVPTPNSPGRLELVPKVLNATGVGVGGKVAVLDCFFCVG